MIHMLHDRLVISRAKVCQMPRTNGYWALWLRMFPCFCLWWIHEFPCRIDHGNWNFPKIKLQLWPYKVVALDTQTRNALCNIYIWCIHYFYIHIYNIYVYIFIHTYTRVCVYLAHSISWSPSSSLHCMLVYIEYIYPPLQTSNSNPKNAMWKKHFRTWSSLFVIEIIQIILNSRTESSQSINILQKTALLQHSSQYTTEKPTWQWKIHQSWRCISVFPIKHGDFPCAMSLFRVFFKQPKHETTTSTPPAPLPVVLL